jgi:hypothetical protein
MRVARPTTTKKTFLSCTNIERETSASNSVSRMARGVTTTVSVTSVSKCVQVEYDRTEIGGGFGARHGGGGHQDVAFSSGKKWARWRARVLKVTNKRSALSRTRRGLLNFQTDWNNGNEEWCQWIEEMGVGGCRGNLQQRRGQCLKL